MPGRRRGVWIATNLHRTPVLPYSRTSVLLFALAPDLHAAGMNPARAYRPDPATLQTVRSMITKQDLERLINREETGRPVVSLFLDMSVNSNNKRTHQVFLNQKRAQFQELQAEWMAEHEEGVETLWDRIQGFLESGYDESCAGVVVYAEV